MEMAILNLMGEVDMSLVKKEMKHLIKINFSKKGIDVVNSNIKFKISFAKTPTS